MSERRTDAAAAAGFSELWRSVSKLHHNKTHDGKTGPRTPATMASPLCNDLLSPRRRGGGRYLGLNAGDSPGDAETSQDIIWDSTSPTRAGQRNTRIVEISDIVDRIAPKNVKPKESSMLQWINDSAAPCTPEIPKPRVRKRSSRQSSVDDLMKLARQFDENMQQDEETSDQRNAVKNNLDEKAKTASEADGSVREPKGPSCSGQAEAELRALFDCSTQAVSGGLSGASADSQEIKDQAATRASVGRRQSGLQTAGHCDPPAEPQGTSCGGFYDDWENDDFLDDSLELALTQNLDEAPGAGPEAASRPDPEAGPARFTSVCEQAGDTDPAPQPSGQHRGTTTHREQRPEPKTTGRSTFKLEPNPRFRPSWSKDASETSLSAARPEANTAGPKPTASPHPDKVTDNQREGIPDSLWDDWDDDALLYQACDCVERTSNSRSPGDRQQQRDGAADGQKKSTGPLPAASIKAGAGASASRPPERAFVRSNSLPGTGCGAASYQGWNIPMKGASSKSGMSQSFPGSRLSVGAFNQRGDASGTFQAGNNNADTTAGGPQRFKSHHTAFKRNVSDSAIISNKGQRAGKCSAAEIERKKQEALARRRQRMQNPSKPP
ncbi:unnamed protein product [Menidia menidia]|uniref:(Atlantic silverside) hypothetical protein n=1 Tax=Menidia menidia TaxID=238744 RepID=A0A8S4BX85_9TELE|nr:unnamed protein product [Menidia menidia]